MEDKKFDLKEWVLENKGKIGLKAPSVVLGKTRAAEGFSFVRI